MILDIIGWPAKNPLENRTLEGVKIILDAGGMIVYPTNTLYGIGASIFSDTGLEKVHELKKRSEKMPFIVMATTSQIKELCEIPEIAIPFFERQEILATAILPVKEVPAEIQYKGTLAVRLPCSELTRSLVEFVGPITSTSANIHRKNPPITCQNAINQLGDKISVYFDSGKLGGTPSTLIDFTGEKPKVIREGALSPDDMRKIYG